MSEALLPRNDDTALASICGARDVPAGYKRTEVGVIPKDWCVCQLDSLGTGRKPSVKAGPFGSSLTKATYVSSGYKVYGQEQVIRGDPQYGDYYIARKTFRDLEACAVHPGDILMSLVGTVGRLLVVPKNAEPGIINPRLLRFSFDPNRILPLFFRFLFESENSQLLLSRSMQGGTMGILNAGILRALKILVPPFAEQRAIAEALSDVDSLLESLDALIAKKRAIKQAAMEQLLTGKIRLTEIRGSSDVPAGYKRTEVGMIPEDWEVASLRSCLCAALDYGINAAAVPFDDKLPVYLRITDIGEDNRYRPSPRVSVNHPDSDSYVLAKGDLVFARTGASVGKSYLYNPVDGALVFAGFLVRARPEPAKLDSTYCAYVVQSERYWKWVAAMSSRSGQPGINGQEYGSFRFPLPKICEQSAIVAVLSDVDAGITALEQHRDKTHAIKQGMMQQLLTGQIRLT